METACCTAAKIRRYTEALKSHDLLAIQIKWYGLTPTESAAVFAQ